MSVPTLLQSAVTARLRQGLGRMVREVACDLDETALCGQLLSAGETQLRLQAAAAPLLASAAQARLPAAWVMLQGVQAFQAYGNQRQQFRSQATLRIIVGDRLHPAADDASAGVWPLACAVRRLLSAQDLALPVSPLQPLAVRKLAQASHDGHPWALLACDFSTGWLEAALDNGNWPAAHSTHPLDALLARYDGRLAPEACEWQRTALQYQTPHTPQDIVNHAAPRG